MTIKTEYYIRGAMGVLVIASCVLGLIWVVI